jgi:hypothetical protein
VVLFTLLLWVPVLLGLSVTASGLAGDLLTHDYNGAYTLHHAVISPLFAATDSRIDPIRQTFAFSNANVVSVVITDLQPANRTISLAVQWGIGDALWSQLVDASTGESILSSQSPGSPPRSPYDSLEATIVFSGFRPDFEVRSTLTIHDLYRAAQETAPAGISELSFPFASRVISITLPILWQQEQYPNDTIHVIGYVTVELPWQITTRAQFAYQKHGSSGPEPIPPLVVEVGTQDDSTLRGFAGTLNQRPAPSSFPDDYRSSPFELTFARNDFTSWYTYLVALVPFILFLMLAQTVMLTPTARVRAGPSREPAFDSGSPSGPTSTADGIAPLQGFILSLAAAMLTVVPLRVVLIPTEVAGITRVDLILAAELLLLLALGLYQQGKTMQTMQTMSHRKSGRLHTPPRRPIRVVRSLQTRRRLQPRGGLL